MDKIKEIERSIIKKYRKSIWVPFIKAITRYELIKENDVIAVCISGGKDSMLLAKLIQEIKKHGKIHFDAKFICMDPGYNAYNRKLIELNSKILGIDIEFFNSDIFDAVAEMDSNPCYMCARMRRGYLYNNALERGCNKIALGHHFDDVIETTLMSLLYNGQFKTMMPKLRSTNFKGMELIRPMYMIKEQSIIDWSKTNELNFIQCACRLTENCTIGQGGGSKRNEMKELIKEFRKKSSIIDNNIFTSLHEVNLETIIGYKNKGKIYNFNELYNEHKI